MTGFAAVRRAAAQAMHHLRVALLTDERGEADAWARCWPTPGQP